MKKLTWMLSISLLLLNLSCGTMPPDSLMCVEMNPIRGECVRIISGEKVTIDEAHPFTHEGKTETWWQMRPKNLIFPSFSWAEQKKFMIKICKKNKNMCDKEISNWERSVGIIDEAQKEKGQE